MPEDRRRRRLQALAGRNIAGYQEIRWEQDRLRAITNPITVRDSHGESHDLGQFLVEIDPSSPTPYVRGWRAGRAVDARHPHVNGGRICYGNYRGQIQLVIESEVYEALLIYTGEILDSVEKVCW